MLELEEDGQGYRLSPARVVTFRGRTAELAVSCAAPAPGTAELCRLLQQSTADCCTLLQNTASSSNMQRLCYLYLPPLRIAILNTESDLLVYNEFEISCRYENSYYESDM